MTVTAQSAAKTGLSLRQERDTICNFAVGGMAAAGLISYGAGQITGFSLAKTIEVLNPNYPPPMLRTIDEFSGFIMAGFLFIAFKKGIEEQIRKFDDYRRQQKQ